MQEVRFCKVGFLGKCVYEAKTYVRFSYIHSLAGASYLVGFNASFVYFDINIFIIFRDKLGELISIFLYSRD